MWYLNLVLIFFVALALSLLIQYHDHEGPAYGDKVCIEGGGWFMDEMLYPQPFLVCGIFEKFQSPEETVSPSEGEHSLENESRYGA